MNLRPGLEKARQALYGVKPPQVKDDPSFRWHPEKGAKLPSRHSLGWRPGRHYSRDERDRIPQAKVTDLPDLDFGLGLETRGLL